MARRTKSKSKLIGGILLLGAAIAGAVWNDPILEQLHKFGIASSKD